ncbi:histone-like nucleoid-structuring protein Lsr2 [Pseudactinotalea sp. Z1748]|uniref:histone-like nucleoid-structuring protein Lsr2 n=1 Tax=Pseudactinotalea sp. Z1748 TaxID=3413027 RepID=UPI003C7EAA23
MAQKVKVLLIDDIDGTDAAETISFGLDGVQYEIDLNETNAARLRDDLATWVGHARRSGGRRKTGRSGTSRSSDASKIRDWARENGFEVSDRGRVPAEVKEAYERAH